MSAADPKKEEQEDTLIPFTEDEWKLIASAYNLVGQRQAELEVAHTLLDGRLFQVFVARGLNPSEYDLNIQQKALVKKS